MYYIVNGMGTRFRPLANFFAISGVMVALLGIGTFPQVNAIAQSVKGSTGIPVWITGFVVTVLVAVVILGGLKRITETSEKLVPFMSVMYVAICLIILFVFRDKLGESINLVISNAFTGTAAVGGFFGATVQSAIRNGIARGVFSNESGLGSAPIAAAAARTRWPAEQGLISMTGTFIDTIVICTLTGLSLIVTGAWQGYDAGAAMTQGAFNALIPNMGGIILSLSLALFAFTTIIGWSYYGERCCEYLFGVLGILPYRIIFILMVCISPFIKLEAIWLVADIVNGLMALPNLIALVALSKVVAAETKLYLEYVRHEK